MAVSSSRLKVDALTPRSGGTGAWLILGRGRDMRVIPGIRAALLFLCIEGASPYDAPIQK
jgi:hypothetical protein